MIKDRVFVIFLTSAAALALSSGGSISQRVGAQDASQAPHNSTEPTVNADPLQWSYRIDRYQLAGDSGAARGEIIYYFKCWMCHNQYTKSAPYLKDLYRHQTLESGQSVDDDSVTAQIKNGGPGMPSFHTSLTDADIADVVAYIREGKCCVEGENPPKNPWYRAEEFKWPVQTATSGGAHGTITIPAGDSPEGVMMQLIAPNGVRTTVFTDLVGNYEFPKMQAGPYTLRIASPLEFKPYHKEVQIDGATKLDDIALERVSGSDFLPAAQEIESQMSGAELVWNLNGTAEEKRALRGCASGCHSYEQVLRNRYDERSWRAIVHRMMHYNGASLINPTTPTIAASENGLDPNDPRRLRIEDMVVKFLARVRGPDSNDGQVQVFPRPRGASTRVVITQYFLPRVIESPHDVAGDSKGGIWFTSHRTRYIGKLDPKTGIITEYAVPLTPGALPGSHRITVDKNDIVWFSEVWAHNLTKFDPTTEKFTQIPIYSSVMPINSPGFNNFALAPDGYIWYTDDYAAVKIDPETGKFVQKFPMKTPSTYDNAISYDGNWWAGGSPPGGGNTAQLLNLKTGKMLDLQTGSEPSNSRRGGFDPVGNAWFGGGNGTLVEVDQKLGRIREFKPPIPINPYSGFYEAMPDKNGEVWAGVLPGREFVRLNPKTEHWTEYMMPEPFSHDRRTWIDNSTDPVTVWYVDYQGYIIRIQPLH
jgi:virginiamycin B lyase